MQVVVVQQGLSNQCFDPVCISWDAAAATYTVETSSMQAVWNYDASKTPNGNQGGGNIYKLFYKPMDPQSQRNLVSYAAGGTNRSSIFTGVGGLGLTDMYATTSPPAATAQMNPLFDDCISDNNADAQLLYASTDLIAGNVAVLKFGYLVYSTSSNAQHYPGGNKTLNQPWYRIDKQWTIDANGVIDLQLTYTLLSNGWYSEPGVRAQFNYEAGWQKFFKYGHSWTETTPRNPYLVFVDDISRTTEQSWDYLNQYHPDWVGITGSSTAPTVIMSSEPGNGGFDNSGMATTLAPPLKDFSMEQGSWLSGQVGAQAIGWFAWWGGNPPMGERYRSMAGGTSWTDHYRIKMYGSYGDVKADSTLTGAGSPVISGVTATPTSATAATISWQTDVPTNGVVEAIANPSIVDPGTGWTAGGWTAITQQTEHQPSPSTNHVVDVTLASPGTYTFRVKSTDGSSGLLSISSDHQVVVPQPAALPTVEPSVDYRASTDSQGLEANGPSLKAVVSGNSRYIAFASQATNFVAGDTNNKVDIFIKDGLTNATARISTTSAGGEAIGGDNRGPSISADGRFVSFMSWSTNLVNGDTNGKVDIFVKQVLDANGNPISNGPIVRVSTDAAGQQVTGDSYSPSISPDGRYVAFVSAATTLVPGDVNGAQDIFVKEIQDSNGNLIENGNIVMASITAAGVQANSGSQNMSPSLADSADSVAFTSTAYSLSTIDTSGKSNIFVKKLKDLNGNLVQNGDLQLISVGYDGSASQLTMGNGSYSSALSADGNVVVFTSWATNLIPNNTTNRCYGGPCMDVYARDIRPGNLTECLTCNGHSHSNTSASVSGDGRYVALSSTAPDLVSPNVSNGRENVFIKDRSSGTMSLLSIDAHGNETQGGSSITPVVSLDGTHVVFRSLAPNLVPGDYNGTWDIFSVTLDYVPPSITATWPDSTHQYYWSDGQILIGYNDPAPSSGIDCASSQVTVDGMVLSGCTVNTTNVSFNVSGLSVGTHTIAGYLKDKAGNQSAPVNSVFSVIDTAPSVITGTWPDSAQPVNWSNGQLLIGYYDPAPSSGIDCSTTQVTLTGADETVVPLSGCTVGATNVSFSVSGLTAQAYSIGGYLKDTAGNQSAPINSSFTVQDTQAPVVTGYFPDTTVSVSEFDLSVGFYDPAPSSGINAVATQVYLDSQQLNCMVTNVNTVCHVTGVGLGTHTIDGSVFDNAGRSTAFSHSFTRQ